MTPQYHSQVGCGGHSQNVLFAFCRLLLRGMLLLATWLGSLASLGLKCPSKRSTTSYKQQHYQTMQPNETVLLIFANFTLSPKVKVRKNLKAEKFRSGEE